MGKMTRWQVRERARRVAEGLNPYHPVHDPAADQRQWAYGQSATTAERSTAGYRDGSAGRSASPMAYTTRAEHYLRPGGCGYEEVDGVPQHMTPAQRKRLGKKLRSQLAGNRRKSARTTRRLATAFRVWGRRRDAVAGQQAEVRRTAFAVRDPRQRAADRREAKREREGTHGYPATGHRRSR